MLPSKQPFNQPMADNVPSTDGNVFHEPSPGIQVLIIDDSNQICSLLTSHIFSECARSNRPVHVVQSGALGVLSTPPLIFTNGTPGEPVCIYTANSPKNALSILNLPEIEELTIISDISMPSDTEVGLLGMLQHIADKQIKVNLVFVSSEEQNRYTVDDLIQANKAYFVEKGSEAWMQLPFALVNHSHLFHYKTIDRSDFERALPQPNVAFQEIFNPVAEKVAKPWWRRLMFWQK